MLKKYGVFIAVFLSLTSASSISAAPDKAVAAGDSITMGFGADCTRNRYFWDLFCLLGGDQPEHSWFDGWDNSVESVHDKYKTIAPGITANKDAAESGSEMRGGSNNFSTQADEILSQTTLPDHVEVMLGGNDICNRDCVDPANCDNPLYTDSEWRSAVQAGLDKLVNGLPSGSTVLLGSVPRVQDLRAAGLDKEASDSGVRCENVWSTFSICRIATNGGTMNGEDFATRYAGINAAQKRYNEILAEEAASYNGINGVEVVAEYNGEENLNAGTFQFSKDDIDGGDCFHPSIQGQNIVADLLWSGNPDT
ncbi:SGNH/GDSL hydrolase family protein [Microbulbifer thermotolerans]|uniref:GDSL-type esterase/lipase family protein n=1 Tax=Microbulbifer thermotolerans TaxID=252514 RepID=A0A143HME4_MICTH|nr:SGNH/GDSL hydrolase family protein [Microbulbifer thermotolerans]AMX02858.1 peptidase [Microbulbifer thermotolerans]MCX2781178.1 GDSL-type esterase/lipase family protein [Microbulbifer thermotolerans]MCX2784467.1 GDSL-type esterase/lipase family protein [Microbulbifer thermotolerans]MCX2796334.1 GDSL-type esterase/lipase family protein [Microbulbifer thermotolerans]MCX2803151.1 GDSL-type esterase/lipase family protein [Microbulbifer thermotolerans]